MAMSATRITITMDMTSVVSPEGLMVMAPTSILLTLINKVALPSSTTTKSSTSMAMLRRCDHEQQIQHGLKCGSTRSRLCLIHGYQIQHFLLRIATIQCPFVQV